MGAPQRRGKQPRRGDAAAITPLPRAGGRDNDKTPVFCLAHLGRDHCLEQLDTDAACAFARTLAKLSRLTWQQISQAPRHGSGFEHMPVTRFRPTLPTPFSDAEKLMVFRYHGKRPMVGYRVGTVFHVLWIERQYGEVYSHD